MIKPEITRILFNHDIKSHEKDAITLMESPEVWPSHDMAYAAYIMNTTNDSKKEKKLTIKVSLRLSEPTNDPVPVYMIRATPIMPNEDQAVLGKVKETIVQFCNETCVGIRNGTEKRIEFELEGTKIQEFGIGAYEFTWLWQYYKIEATTTGYREESPSWVGFETTKITAFVILDIPKFPWTLHHYTGSQEDEATKAKDPNLDFYGVFPWVNALDIACRYLAPGSKSVEEVAKQVTLNFYEFQRNKNKPFPGSNPFTYHAGKNYFVEVNNPKERKELINGFAFSKLLDRIYGGPGLGERVNCDDCAAIVVIFANLLGCDLKYGKLVPKDKERTFNLNPVKLIGKTDAENDMSVNHHSFAYLERKDNTVEEDRKPDSISTDPNSLDPNFLIYDASLRFDEQKNGKHDFLPVAGMKLGEWEKGKENYTTLLLKNNDTKFQAFDVPFYKSNFTPKNVAEIAQELISTFQMESDENTPEGMYMVSLNNFNKSFVNKLAAIAREDIRLHLL